MKKLALLAASAATVSFSAAAADKVTYDDQVLPIFRNACNNCHNPDKKKAGLDLTTYQATLQGSENGKVLQSGNPGGSLLLKCVKQTEDPKMPPKGDKLNDQDIALIEKWIAGQLLENATGKAVAAASNNVSVAVVSLTKPDGPPPMPGELPIEPVLRTRATNALTALAVSPWAPVVAIGGQKQILLYHTETLEPLGVLPFPEGFPTIIRFSRNGQLLLTGGGLGGKSGKVVLWDIKTGDRIATIGNEVDQVLAADLSPNQQFVALGGPNKLVKIYSTKDGKLLTSIKKHTDWVTAIAYSPDGKYLASADRNGGIQVWEGATGKEFNALPGHKAMVTGLAFMPGVLASSSEDGKIALWDVKEGKEIRSWAAHNGGAEWVDFTPDGRLASAGRDKIAKAWDQNGGTIGKTEPFADIALRAVLSNDRVIAGDWSGTVRVTNLAGKELGQLALNPPTIADRLTESNKRAADLQASLPGLQQALTAAKEKVAAEKAAAEAKKKADNDSLEAAKTLPPQIEKKVADVQAQIDPLTQALAAADDAGKPAAQQKLDAQKKLVADAQAELPKAQAALKEKLAAVEAAKAAEAKLVAQINDLTKQVESKKGDVDKALQTRNQQKENTGPYAQANTALTARTGELTQLQNSLITARKTAGQIPSDNEDAATKAQAALDGANAQLIAAAKQVEKWKLAQVFQSAYNAKRSVAEKQAAYEGLVETAKTALQPIDQIRNDIVAGEKAITETAAKIPEKEKLYAAAQAAVTPASQAVGNAQMTLADAEKALKTTLENARVAAAAKVDELNKQVAQLKTEVGPLTEALKGKAEGSPELAEATKLLEAKKAEIPKTQAALEEAKKLKPEESAEAKNATAEIGKARENLDKVRATAKEATDKAATAEKELAQAKAGAEQATKHLAELKAKEPEVIKTAQTTKVEAEKALPTAEKDLAAAKAEAEKLRSAYETAKAGGQRSAAR